MTVFFSQLINGLSLGSIYALIALGYSMVYGIILLLNFAHGDVIMVGAYMSWFVMNQLGLGPVTAVCATILTCTLLGVVIERSPTPRCAAHPVSLCSSRPSACRSSSSTRLSWSWARAQRSSRLTTTTRPSIWARRLWA